VGDIEQLIGVIPSDSDQERRDQDDESDDDEGSNPSRMATARAAGLDDRDRDCRTHVALTPSLFSGHGREV
jgi:hypothetical protein